MTATADRLVDDYLKRLDRELGDLPRARCRELADEIAGHIEEARADLHIESEAEIRNLLERLGDPAVIAAEERERLGVQRGRAGAIEILALIGILVGGIVLPFIGWIIGLVLLWVSDAWTTRQKLLGTFVVPGGLAPGLFLLGLGVVAEACSRVYDQSGALVSESCSNGSDLLGVVGPVIVIVLLIAPLATTAFLAVRLQRPVYQPSPGSA
jgi:HAAS